MSSSIYELGEVRLQHGGVLPDARIAFEVHGKLNADRSNAVLFPTWFSGDHTQVPWMIGADKALDPAKWCVVVVNIFGNGFSSSPSNTAPPYDRARFPLVSILDNVMLQRRLLREHLDIEHLAMVVGRSMGAQLAFQWASYYPDEVDRMLALCGSARTSPHNYIFLAAVKGAIKTDAAWQGGDYTEPPALGLRQLRTVYDGWLLSQTWYREKRHLEAGYASTQAYLDRPDAGPPRDANDLLAQVATWQAADIGANDKYHGDFEAALGAISARSIVMPSKTDLYFPPEDSEYEVRHMPNAELRVIPTIWGHRAAAPGADPQDIQRLVDALHDLLAQ